MGIVWASTPHILGLPDYWTGKFVCKQGDMLDLEARLEYRITNDLNWGGYHIQVRSSVEGTFPFRPDPVNRYDWLVPDLANAKNIAVLELRRRLALAFLGTYYHEDGSPDYDTYESTTQAVRGEISYLGQVLEVHKTRIQKIRETAREGKNPAPHVIKVLQDSIAYHEKDLKAGGLAALEDRDRKRHFRYIEGQRKLIEYALSVAGDPDYTKKVEAFQKKQTTDEVLRAAIGED